MYGDSLTVESEDAIRRRIGQVLPGWGLHVRAVGGAAQCDFHDWMIKDREELAPSIVIVAFSGNRLTNCMTSRVWPASIRSDAAWAIEHWGVTSARIAFLGAPPRVGEASNEAASHYADVATAHQVPFTSAHRLFVDPATGNAAQRLGCAPSEGVAQGCTDGSINVRHRDEAHLCTRGSSGGACSGYASGAERYASMFADAAASAARKPFASFPDAVSAPSPVS